MRKYLVLVSVSLVVIVGAFSFVPDVSAATCVLKSVQWDKTRAAVGELVGFKITTENCRGQNIAFTIYEDDPITPDEVIVSSRVVPSNSDTITEKWGVNLSFSGADSTGDNEFYILAQVVGGAGAGSKLQSSNNLYVRASGVGTGGLQITAFDISPKNTQKNITEGFTFTFKAKVDKAEDLHDYCNGRSINWYVRRKGTTSNVSLRSGSVPVSSTSTGPMQFKFDFSTNISTGPTDGEFAYVGEIKCGNLSLQVSNPVSYFVGISSGSPSTTCGNPGQPACASGASQSYQFTVPNWLKGEPKDLVSLLDIIAKWLFNLAIPVAVGLIIYAGVLLMTAGANPAYVKKGGNILKWVAVGLAIIFINKGFISLIRSILELGNS